MKEYISCAGHHAWHVVHVQWMLASLTYHSLNPYLQILCAAFPLLQLPLPFCCCGYCCVAFFSVRGLPSLSLRCFRNTVNTGFHSAHKGLGDGGQKQEAKASSCSGVHRGNERMRRPKKQTQPHPRGSKCQQGVDT